MIVVPFKAEHLLRMRVQDAQTEVARISPELAVAIERTHAVTALVGDQAIACAGIKPHWAGRVSVWGCLSRDAGKHFVALHRAALRFLDVVDAQRIELTAACDFPAAHRWARMLGFELEAERMRGYGYGRDFAMYARVHT